MAGRGFPEVETLIRTMIAQTPGNQSFRDIMASIMSRPGRVLNHSAPAKWPAFVMVTCQALGGDTSSAIPAAAAVEFIVAAADVVDDLVDDEWDRLDQDWARSLNISLGLSWLTQRCVGQLEERIGPARVQQINRLITDRAMASCAGEDWDILLEKDDNASEEDVHEMTVQKSGSLVALACQVGAAIATPDNKTIDLVGVFGHHLGAIAQLLNDIEGVANGSDLRRKKKTLPIAYALCCARDEQIDSILKWFSSNDQVEETKERELSALMTELGALHFASVVAEAHRREALATLRELNLATGINAEKGLKRLIPRIWTSGKT